MTDDASVPGRGPAAGGDPKAERGDEGPGNFIADLVAADAEAGRLPDGPVTRFPPEPNGYLHIGHAKSIALNFGLAERFGGRCNLRFDDTNPETESTEYVESIKRDVRWLGFDWGDREHYASDYFDRLYAWAERLVREGKAYVDSQDMEAIRKNRGNFHEPGVESPYRARSVDENLDLLRRMRDGEFAEGAHVLRAKIDMRSKDLKLRDPLMYRIRRVPHHRTGTKWCIYPMYDWAHGQSDAIEGVTHSLCTLEFQNHRGLYDWFLHALGFADDARPHQTEFAKLQFTYVMLSKRRLKRLVDEGHVSGWDDPRMPTLAGLRRLGYPPEAILALCERVGVSKRDGVVDIGHLEHEVREHLNRTAVRRMGVLDPVRLVIENWESGRVEEVELANHPEYPELGTRKVPFAGDLFVERDDWMDDPPKKWFRLGPGREVRLRGAALVTVTGVERDGAGRLTEIRCTWDPSSRGGTPSDGRKVRGTIHWVSAAHAVPAEVRLYDRLFTVEDPTGDEDRDFVEHLNPDSLVLRPDARLEASVGGLGPGDRFQLERLGYFTIDTGDSATDRLVVNRTITLKDSWAKIAKKL